MADAFIKGFGKLVKLKISAVDSSSGCLPFEAMFNPESYSEKYTNIFKPMQGAKTGIEDYKFIKSIPQDFSLKIIIDGTGVSEFHVPFLTASLTALDEFVYNKVTEFLKLTWYPVKGKPNALKIEWGKLSFFCKLSTVNVNYTLFNRDGIPLRAELDATFAGDGGKNGAEYKKRFGDMSVDTSSGSNGLTVEV